MQISKPLTITVGPKLSVVVSTDIAQGWQKVGHFFLHSGTFPFLEIHKFIL